MIFPASGISESPENEVDTASERVIGSFVEAEEFDSGSWDGMESSRVEWGKMGHLG